MLPTTVEEPSTQNDFEVVNNADLPSKTYYMDLDRSRIRNLTDGQAAMKQSIFKILQTERYDYNKIYSDNYGVELDDLYGMPVSYCVPEIQRRITEALTWDERISRVSNFSFETRGKIIAVSFTAYTIFGKVAIENFEVNT